MKPLNENEATILRKYRIGLANSLGFRNYVDSLRAKTDLDPQRTANKNLASALQKAGVPTREMTGDEAFNLAASDSAFSVTYLVLPIGFTPGTDQGNVVVIDGMHDARIPVAALVEYGLETNGLSDEIEMRDFVCLFAELQAAKKQELEGGVKVTSA